MGSHRVASLVAVAALASLLSAGAARAVAQLPDTGNPAPARRQAQPFRARASDGGRQAGSVRRLERRRPHLPLQHRSGSRSPRTFSPGPRRSSCSACAIPGRTVPSRDACPVSVPFHNFFNLTQDRPDSGAHRDAVRVSQQPASNRVHRWPRSSQGSQSHLAGLLGRTMGGGHARRDDRGVQRPGLARQRRTSADRIAAHHGTPPASRLRPHGFRNDHRRSESVHEAVHHQDGAAAGGRTPIYWRTSAKTRRDRHASVRRHRDQTEPGSCSRPTPGCTSSRRDARSSITATGDLLFVQGLNEPRLPLLVQSDTHFMSTATPNGFEFVKDAQGRSRTSWCAAPPASRRRSARAISRPEGLRYYCARSSARAALRMLRRP